MKAHINHLIFAGMIFGLSLPSDAQTLANLNVKNSGTISNHIADDIIAGAGEANSNRTAALTAYERSEQYVFDNLDLLKETFSIGDIYFDLDQSLIRKDAENVLRDLLGTMNAETGISVAISASCDSRVSSYNTILAQKRAEAAKAYLVDNGIAGDRIIIEKNGRQVANNPCKTNVACTIAEQQLNRKVEFNIIYNGRNLAHLSSYHE